MSFLARVSYTSNGSTPTFSFSFPYIAKSHIKAFVNGVEDTNITFPTSSSVTLSSTPANGATVTIQRFTPTNSRLIDFQDGSVLTSADLDQSADQNFFIAQETTDNVSSNLSLTSSNVYDANNKRIINVANPINAQDAVTKHYLENTWLSTSDKANITTVAGVSSQIALLGVASVITDMNTLGTTANVNNISTVASNITDVNSFANRYRISASDPTTSLDAGDLAFVTGSSQLKFYDGSAWQAISTSGSGDIDGVTAGTGLSGGGTTGTVTLNIDNTVATLSGTQTFTNKTIDADGTGNSITNIDNANIKASAAIDATKIHNGNVSNTEFGFLDGVTSAIQTQLDSKLSNITGQTLGSLSDVTITSPSSGQVIRYNGTAFVNATDEDNLANNDTDDLSEGSSNLYYTDARFDTRFGTKSTTNLSEGSNLYYTDARADARVNLQTGSNLDLSNKSTSDLTEGTNLYYTDARFDTRLGTKDTDNLSEGSSNLYFTNARADARINLQTGSNLNLSNKSTSDLSEGTNLYYTDERVDDRVNALLTAGDNITLTYNDAGNSLTIAATQVDNSIPFAIALG